MKGRLLYPAAALALAAALAGCGSHAKEGGAAKQKAEEKPVPVQVALVRLQPVQRTVDVVGTLEPYEEAAVGSDIEGRVVRVLVDMGDYVAKGRPVVKIDDEGARINVSLAEAALKEALAKLGVDDEDRLVPEETSSVKKAKAELRDAELNLSRMKGLSEKGYVSRAELDAAQNRYDADKAALESQMEATRSQFATVKNRRAALELARKSLRDTEVKAPISGYVSKRTVDPGDYVKVGGELLRIVNVDPIRLRGEVPEVNARDVRLGQLVKVGLSAVPDREFVGRICRINPSSSPQSRSFTVEVQIPNKGAALKPGYFANASIQTRMDTSAVTVPLNSLVMNAGITKLFVVKDGKAQEAQVTPGVKVGDYVEVTGDVGPGDQVVTEGMKRLYNGRTVSLRK